MLVEMGGVELVMMNGYGVGLVVVNEDDVSGDGGGSAGWGMVGGGWRSRGLWWR